MREMPLPSGFEGLVGKVQFVHRATATEYASSCPNCGGNLHKDGSWPDRFRMFIVGKQRGWCRKCSYLWFPDMSDPNWRPDPEMIRKWQEEREAQYRAQMHSAQHALRILEQEKMWLEWHERMDDHARKLWEEAGIPRDWQDYWQLGYTNSKVFEHNGERYDRPALTIPKFDFNWIIKNVDYRLIDPPQGVGRYRPVPNVPQFAFISTPEEKCFRDEVFVVEGSKKAMVVSIYVGEQQKQVIGLPSCSSWAGMEENLCECGRVWVILDPGAEEWAIRFAQSVGKNARVVELPHKPDDAILNYGLTASIFNQILRQSTRV